MRSPGVFLRSRALRAATRGPGWARAAAGPLVAAGPVAVSGGIAVGMRLAGVGTDHVQAYGLVRGSLEPGVQEALRRHVAPGSVFYDVGANIGFFTLVAARLGAAVHAFEPLPASAALVRENARLNGLGDVVVHEVAVGERSGRSVLLAVDEASWSHLEDRGRHARTAGEVEVEVVALDELEGVPAPDVVKVDVEGSEVDVIAGMRRLLAEARPALVVELHATNAEFVAAMDEAAYRVENLDGPEPVAEAGAVHALAVPRND